MSLAELKKRYQEAILDGMARALWIEAFNLWSDLNEKCRWCQRSISQQLEHVPGGEDETFWIDEHAGADCPDSDEGHEPDPNGASGIEIEPGGDLDERTPETPDAAYLAAHDLQKLLAASEGVKKESSAMSELFEIAMTIHTGEPFQFADLATRHGSAIGKQRKLEDLAAEFGFSIAMESLEHGTGWGDSHVTKRGNAEFNPAIPRFEVNYDGEELTWSGVARDADRLKATTAPADDLARRGSQQARYAAEDLPITQGTLGMLVVVNGDNAPMARHRYVIQIAGTKFLVYEDSEGDALDEVVDFIVNNEHEFGGLLSDGVYNERADEARQSGTFDDEEVDNIASEGLVSAGNFGNWLDASEVHITPDPPREQLYQMAGVAQNPARPKKGKKRGRKNPDVGDEWGPGGAESGELVMMVEDAIDPKGPLAAYKPKVFSPLSPEGVAERTLDAKAFGHKEMKAVIPRSVFVTLHPKAAAKALNPMLYAEHGKELEGKFLIDHVNRLFNHLTEHLDRKWPMPNATWTVIPYGWGFMALTDNERDDKIDQPSESATFAIGLEDGRSLGSQGHV